MIYVASPYSDPNPGIVDYRVAETMRYCAWLFQEQGLHPFSPIAHWHGICKAHIVPTDAAHWASLNRDAMRRCDAVHLLELPGWRYSAGVELELRWAEVMGLPIMHARVERHGFVLASSDRLD